MLSHATFPLNHAESASVKEDDALVLRDRMRKPRRHRLLHGYPLAAAMRRPEARRPKDVFFDASARRDLLMRVLPRPFCNLTASGCGFCTFPRERYHSEQASKVVEIVVREFDVRLARHRALTRRRVVALDSVLELLARLGFAGFLTMGFVAAIGLTSGMSIVNPIAIPLCAGLFLWNLVLISCVTSRRA
jgi:hypothetical protein